MKGIDAMFDHGEAVGARKELDWTLHILKNAKRYGISVDSLLVAARKRAKHLNRRLDKAARANCQSSSTETP
jgi:hypothetical protein